MKRKVYEIKFDGNVVTKNAFNSSIRKIEAIVAKIARVEKTTYYLTNSATIEKDGSGIIKGSRQWTGENGRVIEFIVEKVA